MHRRSFLRSTAAASIMLPALISGRSGQPGKFLKANNKRFDYLEVKGSYRRIGLQTGMFFEKHIKEIIRRRKDWHRQLVYQLNSKKGKHLSGEMLRLTKKYFPHILEEIEGIAEGAGISFEYFWAMTIKSELSLLNEEETPGCSTIFVNDGDKMWLFHNEDGGAPYRDIMYTLRVVPPSGVEYISMVYPGIITGNGPSMNSSGIIQTTNYIGSNESTVGLPRYVIGRAILEAKSMNEAIQIATISPRAYPYHHNLASVSEQKYFSLETVPEAHDAGQPEGIYFRTNHLILDKTKSYAHEDQKYRNSSSMSRYSVIKEALEDFDTRNIKPEDFLAILSSHKNAPYSPCRHPKDDVQGLTLGTAFFDIKAGLFRLYKGNPCQAVENSNYVDFRV